MRWLLLAVLVTACGEESGDQQGATETSAPEVQHRQEEYYVQAAEDLAKCDETTAHRVVYVVSTETFMFCDSIGGWREIEARGEKGDRGDVGERGEQGAPGSAGADGIAGADGAAGAAGPKGDKGDPGDAGEDGQTVTDTQWYDPIEDVYWTFSKFNTTFPIAQATCVNGWRLPTSEEFVLANMRGLGKVTDTANLEAWLLDGTHVRFDGTQVGNNAAPYCREDL